MKRSMLPVNILILLILITDTQSQTYSISGYVTDGTEPCFYARVRVRSTGIFTRSNEDGSFTLEGITSLDTLIISAWDRGYYNGDAQAVAGDTGVIVKLNPLPTEDNPDYQWISHEPDSSDEMRCGNCHTPALLQQWQNNAHANSATNPYFLAMYYGTDINGLVEAGPSYKTDYPDSCGSCATCHIPGAAVHDPFNIDPKSVTGVSRDGVFCDFCHKINNTYESNGADLPGVLAIDLLRPFEGNQVFFGPYDDIHEPDAYSPLIVRSYVCAPCHTGQFWGTPAYGSFQEWFDSPYRTMIVECQDCHMLPDGVSTHFVLPEKGGRTHNPLAIPSHLQPGSRDPQILANSVTMKMEVLQIGDSIRTKVTIFNDKTGHHVPTGRPSRNIILLVDAVTSEGDTLNLINGQLVPEWAGTGSYLEGNYAGYAGKGFAKILEDSTKMSPAPSWRPARIITDNRIAAFATDTSYFYFKSPISSEKVTIKARLIYRRFFKSWMDVKKFDIPDIEMENETLEIITSPLRIDERASSTVNTFKLAQNFPNPFNPYTVICWQLAVGSHTELTVYNLLGEKVVTLVTEYLKPGNHSYRFDGNSLPSGIYFYRLLSGKHLEVKKMILAR